VDLSLIYHTNFLSLEWTVLCVRLKKLIRSNCGKLPQPVSLLSTCTYNWCSLLHIQLYEIGLNIFRSLLRIVQWNQRLIILRRCFCAVKVMSGPEHSNHLAYSFLNLMILSQYYQFQCLTYKSSQHSNHHQHSDLHSHYDLLHPEFQYVIVSSCCTFVFNHSIQIPPQLHLCWSKPSFLLII